MDKIRRELNKIYGYFIFLALDDTVEEEAKAVMDNVKLGFEQMLNQTKWLTNETDKAKAKEKLDKMGSYIGQKTYLIVRIFDKALPYQKSYSNPQISILLKGSCRYMSNVF